MSCLTYSTGPKTDTMIAQCTTTPQHAYTIARIMRILGALHSVRCLMLCMLATLSLPVDFTWLHGSRRTAGAQRLGSTKIQ